MRKFAVLTIVFLVFLPSAFSYFQQDEWTALGYFYSLPRHDIPYLFFYSFIPYASHWVPLGRFGYYLYMLLFGIRFEFYALASILSHVLVTYFSYRLFRLFLEEKLAALTALLFGINPAIHQATTWVAADVNTHGATIFGILSMLTAFTHAKSKSLKPQAVAISALFVSLLFKEIALGLFLFIPITIYLLADRRKGIAPVLLAYLGSGVFYLFLRMLLLSRVNIFQPEDSVVTDSQSLGEIFFNILTFPVKVFVGSLIPAGNLLQVVKRVTLEVPDKLTPTPNTTAFDVFVQDTALLFVSITILTGVVLLIWRKRKAEQKFFWIMFLSILFVFINSAVYALSPGRGGSIPVVDSRNLYFPSLGSMAVLVLLLYTYAGKKYFSYLFFVAFSVYIAILLQIEKGLVDIGRERRVILSQIKSENSTIPDRVLFYTESDSSFYGLPEEQKLLPFQVNFGYTLMVFYYADSPVPRELLGEERVLWGITDQGYQHANGHVFGYYRDFELLQQDAKELDIAPHELIAYSYDTKKKKLTNISTRTYERIFKNQE